MEINEKVAMLMKQGCSVKAVAEALELEESEVRDIIEQNRVAYFESRKQDGYSEGDDKQKPLGHSRRYRVVGLMRGIAEMAGFEVVDRIVLRDKRNGEVLR